MVSGNPMIRTYAPTLEQKAIDFVCLRKVFSQLSIANLTLVAGYSAGQANTYGNELPPRNCEAGLRAQVAFPCELSIAVPPAHA